MMKPLTLLPLLHRFRSWGGAGWRVIQRVITHRRTLTPSGLGITQKLVAENEALRARLQDAEEILRAIRSGEVDALLVSTPKGEQVFTLKGADYIYRMLIETMSEGALTVTMDGVIFYANQRFAEMLKTPLEKVIGSRIHRWITPTDQTLFQALLRLNIPQTRRHGEVTLLASDGT